MRKPNTIDNALIEKVIQRAFDRKIQLAVIAVKFIFSTRIGVAWENIIESPMQIG
jgi:hypothetical protein